ncbi:MAG: hypothetical protein GY869_14690 [Planctomycetes bacterium]|nr:hypothetical protein [Planctomycetota bacterium]
MKYEWKRGVAGGLSAETVGKYIDKLDEKHGGVTPELLLNESRKKKSPLRDCFEWNDTTAAEKYRLHQARHILRAIVVTSENDENATVKVRAFVPVVEDDNHHYTTINRAMSDKELRKQVLTQAVKDLSSWQQKYENLKEFSDVYASIKKVKKKYA